MYLQQEIMLVHTSFFPKNHGLLCIKGNIKSKLSIYIVLVVLCFSAVLKMYFKSMLNALIHVKYIS